MAAEIARMERPEPKLSPPPVIVARLREKITDLERQRAQNVANTHACTGAIQALQALIVEFEEADHA